jgi:phosphatidate cytidylyltransferase
MLMAVFAGALALRQFITLLPTKPGDHRTLFWVFFIITPLQAAGMAALVVLMGFTEILVISAIKRDRGVKDWGTTIGGHGGFMGRMGSLSFAAPVFFHVSGFCFGH